VTSEATRTRILEAARELLESHAWPTVGLEGVARAAGVSRQAIYLHFGSRAALLLALVDHVDRTEGLTALVARVHDAPTGTEALQRLVHLNAVYEPRIRAVATAHDAARRIDDDLEAAWQNRMRRRRDLCRHVIARLDDDGALSQRLERTVATDLLWALLGSRVHEDLVGSRRWSRRRYETYLLAALHCALTPDDDQR
jgi:AcrR family transcriptional regulator